MINLKGETCLVWWRREMHQLVPCLLIWSIHAFFACFKGALFATHRHRCVHHRHYRAIAFSPCVIVCCSSAGGAIALHQLVALITTHTHTRASPDTPNEHEHHGWLWVSGPYDVLQKWGSGNIDFLIKREETQDLPAKMQHFLKRKMVETLKQVRCNGSKVKRWKWTRFESDLWSCID